MFTVVWIIAIPLGPIRFSRVAAFWCKTLDAITDAIFAQKTLDKMAHSVESALSGPERFKYRPLFLLLMSDKFCYRTETSPGKTFGSSLTLPPRELPREGG
jgi:hypothetical protein